MKKHRTEAWTASLRERLSKRGSKTELARLLSADYGQSEHSWQCRISDILENRYMPRAEVYLAIEEFLSKS
jgi:hypothetical protein